MMRMRTWLLSTTCLVAAVGGAQAADFSDTSVAFAEPSGLPAVSAPNGKLSAFGGGQDGTLYGLAGSFTVPLGFAYGLQVDGLVGSGDGAAFYGVAGHAFWRDPAKGLIGVYGSYVGWEASDTVGVSSPIDGVADVTGADVGKIGLEGAAYLGPVSLEGLGAYQFGDRTGFTGKATLAVYPGENLRFDGGVRYLDGVGAIGTVGAEWQPHDGSGFTLFASGAFGADDYSQVLGGVRVYFSDTHKSLIKRHREDDPGNDLPDDLFTTTGGGYCPADKPYYDTDGNTCTGDR
jgi:hypothetical protein